MISVSLCLIVKNGDATIERCLSSIVDLVEEIVVVDTGSTDQTKRIVGKFTDRVYDFKWNDDFAAARNFSFAKATKDYILWLDADDFLTEADRVKFIYLKETLDPAVDVVMLPYAVGFDEHGQVTFTYLRERLLKRKRNFQWQEPVHEYITPSGKVQQADVCITHGKLNLEPSDRNLRIYEKHLRAGGSLSPRGQLYYAMELYYRQRYVEAVPLFNDFLEGGKGWSEDNIKAAYYLGKSYVGLNEPVKAFAAFLASFQYDLPRAEICCELAYLFKVRRDFRQAIFWFELATKLEKPEHTWGFIYQDYWDFIPWLELAVCNYWAGNNEQAVACNEKAATFKPNDTAVLYNRHFFEELTLDRFL